MEVRSEATEDIADQRNATDSWQERRRVQVQPKVYPM